MGEDYPVFPIAAPVWDRMAGAIAPRGPVMPECEMWIAGSVNDSADYAPSPDSLAGGIFPPEFMSAGKPVIAPRHTAMADYIDESAARAD